MRKYKYIIVDDDDMDRLAINYYLKGFSSLECSASFSSSKDVLNYIEDKDIDILFLDIDMPKFTGLDLQKAINKKVVCTIFVTSYSEYALDGFNLNAFDYIVKPLSKERFNLCITRLLEYLKIVHKADLYQHSFNETSIVVKEGYNYVTISPHDVIYLEALKDYTKIISLDKKTTTIHGNLGTVLKSEHFKDFIRIQKSYATQKKFIRSINNNKVTLTDGSVLPIGSNYKKSLLNTLI